MVSPLILYGKSGRKYKFHSTYPLSDISKMKFDENWGILYIYFYISSSNNVRLIYCGKDETPPKRFKEHERNDKDIIEASNYAGIIYYDNIEKLKADEVDILEGNSFEKNIQHNC